VTKPGLDGVPETLLWTLYLRATEARRPDAVLADPKAVELVEALDYPFERQFGAGELGQWQALRALCFDREIERFLAEHPDGTVVALGEGLETQFWRVDNGRVQWVTVDLPETVRLREQLLPARTDRQRTIACSALDETWMDQVDPSRGLLVTAQGLFMYFQPADVHGLLRVCADRFPRATMVFDGVPRRFSAKTLRGEVRLGQGYQAPPMPWAVDAAEKARLRAVLHPNLAELRDLAFPRGRGLVYGVLLPLLNRVPAILALDLARLPILRARFGPPAAPPAPPRRT
jgi:O-methyltransferase involved in polyketide biosynthesis